MFTVFSSDLLTTSCNLLESCGIGLIPAVLFIPAGAMAHLCGFASKYRIELAELGWSKSGVNYPFLSMMIRSLGKPISRSRNFRWCLIARELRTVNVQESRPRQKSNSLSEVRAFGVVVPPKYVLQRYRVREHKNVLLLTQIIPIVSTQNAKSVHERDGSIPQSIPPHARRYRTQPST